ncbi:hypothetical protein [Halobacteriovorax sp. HLS]|uniref:hypothetical protein n=1 Tax=Halobacteriovorax sp. HLS TaxID=2234000 RepID=UPI000FDB37EA|nr:hypothetical protein [Halobacteriovorax sp. HLS]
MKKVLASFLIFILSISAQAGFFDFLKPAEINERVREEIADLDIHFNVDLLDVDLFEGVGISSRYRYEVEPSYMANHFTRVDKWEIKADIRPGDIIKDAIDSPIYLNIDKNSSIYFVRQFESKKDAITAIPYSFNKLPINADRAIEKLQPGDFVSIPANMSVTVGASTGFLERVDGIDAAARVYYVLNGKFLIHIFRMKDNKVRVKLIAQRSNGLGGGVGLKGDVELFGVSILDDQIDKIFDMDAIDIDWSKGKGTQFLIDYVFDLNDSDAKEAYNQILSSTYKFKDLSIFQDFLSGRELEVRLLSSYELADQLADEDHLGVDKRVRRVFKGTNDYEYDRNKIKLGLLLASYKRDISYTENLVSFEESDGRSKFFYYPIHMKQKRKKFGVWPFKYKEEVNYSFFGLVPVRERRDEGHEYSDYGFTYDVRDKEFFQTEQVKFKQKVRDNIPKELYDTIDWAEFNDTESHRSARGFFQIIFKASAFKSLSDITFEELNEKIQDYYRNRLLLQAGPVHGVWQRIWRTLTIVKITEKRQLKKIAKKLHFILTDKTITGKTKINELLDLREKLLFEKVGIGFLISLLDQDHLEDHLFITLNLHAKDTQEVVLKYGDQKFSKLYHELQYAHNAINNRSWDLRLSSEQDVKKPAITTQD